VARIVLILLALAAAGCGGADGEGDVVASLYPLAFAAERIAADGTQVVDLTPPGAEPHDLELSARDAERLADAKAVLYLGGGFQPAVEDALEATGAEGVDLLAGVKTREGEEHGHEEEGAEHGEGEHAEDPHIWLDPARFAQVAERIGAELGRDEAAAALAGELRALDGEFRRGLADCERDAIVTSHAAFGYLAERYGLEQVAVTGIDPEAEATPGDLAETVARVRETGATTVFFERLVSPRLAETVAREVGAETAVLDPLESEPEEGDYFTAMRANLAALRKALGCR
jgi:zinc transport system substrate-binding protein